MDKRKTFFATGVAVVLVSVIGYATYTVICMKRQSSLVIDARKGDVLAVRRDLESGADPNISLWIVGGTALRAVADKRNAPKNSDIIVGLLIDHGASADQALQFAIRNDQLKIAQVAVLKGANVNQVYYPAVTPLSLANARNDVAIAKFLSHHGAKK